MDARGSEVSAAREAASTPYVGLRPFERQERDYLFGRGKDAHILCDRIAASRLTILYALSGLGKSSLLRALVVPQLEESHASVLYWDAWSQADPLAALKRALAELAAKRGVPDQHYSALSLTEIARLLASADERGLVLVFDQFEEFLVRHAQDLDPLRSELAALIRAPKLDVAVVLTLREEFLAALEPFRQRILNLFQSAYRLESLANEDLCLAIRQPAKLAGGDCEGALADEIIKDLKGGESGVSASPQVSLDLPILQLVCQELWKKAPEGRLSLALYERLGRTPKIIESYVRELMPRRGQAQVFTARLLTYLAPPSGLKYSYSVGDLAEITKFPTSDIERELNRLSEAGILRRRDYSGGTRYELEHDAFIPVLRAWRREILDRDRRRQLRRRMLAWTAAAVVILIGGSFGWVVFERVQRAQEIAKLHQALELDEADAKMQEANAEKQKANADKEKANAEKQRAEDQEQYSEQARQQLVDWQSKGQLADLKNQQGDARIAFAPSRFDSVTSYFLLKRTDEQRFADLRTVLERYEKLIPPDYAEPITTEAIDDNAPLTIEFSSRRKLDPQRFMITWQKFGGELATHLRIPVSRKLRFQAAAVDTAVVRIRGGGETVDLSLPVNEREYLIRYSLDQLDNSPAKEFLVRFRAEWHSPANWAFGSQWLLVPQWSLPVWKLARDLTFSEKNKRYLEGLEIAIGPSGITAFLAMQKLTEPGNRKLFFSEPTVAFLIRKLPEDYETTLDEAAHARGNCLARDVAAKLHRAGNVSLVPRVLDALANQPAESSCFSGGMSSAAGRTRPTQTQLSIGETAADKGVRRLHGPWGTLHSTRMGGDDGFMGLENAASVYQPLYVHLGRGLAKSWMQDAELRPDVEQNLTAERSGLYRRYGVALPGAYFDISPQASGDRILRIEVPGDPDVDAATAKTLNREQTIDGGDSIKLAAALRDTYTATRELWITPESVQAQLDSLPPKTSEWLQRTYSVTDLKIVLRMVLGSGATDGSDSVRYTNWLLSSLVFWAAVEPDPLMADGLRDDLRRLEHVRLSHRGPAASVKTGAQTACADTPGTPSERIHCGAKALAADDPEEAIAQFKRLKNLEEARELFCAEWTRRLGQVWLRDYRGDFKELRKQEVQDKPLDIDASDRLDLADLPETETPKAAREIAVYRAAAGLEAGDAPAAIRSILDRYGSVPDWPEDQARWVAVRFFGQYDPVDQQTGNERQFAMAERLLESAVSGMDQDAAREVFEELVVLSQRDAHNQSRPIPNWAWKLMEGLANVTPGGGARPPNLKLELAWQLAAEEREDRLWQGLTALNAYEQALSAYRLSPEEAAEQHELIDFTKARIDLGLLRSGHENRFEEAKLLFTKLLSSERPYLNQNSHSLLLIMLYEQHRDREAAQVRDAGEKRWPEDPYLAIEDLWAQVERGNRTAVTNVAQHVHQLAEQIKASQPADSTDALLSLVMSSMVTQTGDWKTLAGRFLRDSSNRHRDRDYVIMIFDAYCPKPDPAGANLLDERWRSIDPKTWTKRLEEGDTGAWREMLIARFKDAPEAEGLLDIVENEERWKNSPLAQLPMPQRAQRCEAWFYEAMRAKSRGDTDRMLYALKRCVAAGFVAYEEHAMATYLLKQIDGGNVSAELRR